MFNQRGVRFFRAYRNDFFPKSLVQRLFPLSIVFAKQANEIITDGDADLVFIGRELLREPYWTIKAEHELGGPSTWPIQMGYAVQRRAK